MEPFRPLIDRYVLQQRWDDFGPEEKRGVVNVLNEAVSVRGRRTTASQAVAAGCRMALDAMESGELESIREEWYEV